MLLKEFLRLSDRCLCMCVYAPPSIYACHACVGCFAAAERCSLARVRAHAAKRCLLSGGKRTETSTLDRMPKRLQATHYNDKDTDQDTNLQRADVIDDMHLDFV